MPLLSCKGLARKPLIEGFNLDLDAGEIVVLRAPSAAGKTLLLRAIADLDEGDGGEIYLDGRERAQCSPQEWRRQVLYLHQVAVRLPGSVLANWRAVACLAALATDAPDEAELPADLRGHVDVRKLSGGEMQRFALARAIALRPRVLLLDECTSALDGAAARAAEATVRAFTERGAAALWVSHDADLAGRLAAREVGLF